MIAPKCMLGQSVEVAAVAEAALRSELRETIEKQGELEALEKKRSARFTKVKAQYDQQLSEKEAKLAEFAAERAQLKQVHAAQAAVSGDHDRV